MDISLALTWILFLGLFPLAFFWLRRAWRILVKQFSGLGVGDDFQQRHHLFHVARGARHLDRRVGLALGDQTEQIDDPASVTTLTWIALNLPESTKRPLTRW
jgi:hypothetical protein